MKKQLLVFGLMIVLALVIGCSETNDNSTPLTGNAVADLNNIQVQEQATKISVVQKEEAKVHEINVNGKNGIEPKELTIKISDKLRFVNKDPANKDMEITMQLGGTRKFITTPVVKPNAYTEYFFAQTGNYTYWTIGYGIPAKVEVVN